MALILIGIVGLFALLVAVGTVLAYGYERRQWRRRHERAGTRVPR